MLRCGPSGHTVWCQVTSNYSLEWQIMRNREDEGDKVIWIDKTTRIWKKKEHKFTPKALWFRTLKWNDNAITDTWLIDRTEPVESLSTWWREHQLQWDLICWVTGHQQKSKHAIAWLKKSTISTIRLNITVCSVNPEEMIKLDPGWNSNHPSK